MKIGLVGSSGGHLTHLLLLEEWWKEEERFWVTFQKEDSESALENEKVYWCFHPTNRNIYNLIRNTILAWKLLRKEKPDVLISSGAAVAVPFFYLGKLLGIKLVYLEVYDRITTPTLTGKLVYPIADAFLVQWEEQKKFYSKGHYMGGLF
ncbi:PssD/Cps14F family polysaccharide biosynthesis glycosyltransferase [Paenibacillus sp. VCA1]|uniref:PssD/Cps14F family polysaccharide biosynthesis glycosyltransferase n=1 Tax=Paenibacillus sp. VCA1 TaxID=3039148 RepID=UPI002870E499|nr:PssD/Cps14F family polysaccharide biosynthesis glycosyltransferase [Paenibacillus sp. VCA1]MDR9854412.1 PssD/Cps14F family polysaccharide biosynthesis glycosyltransferase [Paenibacillus sp. VCA1]